MTTNAALAAQVTSALTRWNDQLDQLADWLTGSPSGGPNADGHYPLTNAEGETALFKSLPYVLDLVTGPADAASVAQAAAEAAETLAGHHKTAAELAQTQAELARDSAQNLRNETEQFRQDVAAYWAAVGSWQSQVSIDAAAAAQSEANALAHADDAIFARDEALVARNAAQVARDEAQSYAASINPANLATKAELQTELDALVGAAPGTLDTLNEIAAALGDDPNFATTMTNSLAGKADIGHSHVIADVTGLQTALDGKQPVGSYAQQAHAHVISEVGGLQAALDGKLSVAGGTVSGTLTVSDTATFEDTFNLKDTTGTSSAMQSWISFRDGADVEQGIVGFGYNDTDFSITNWMNGDVKITASGGNVLLNPSGNVGIGTSSPTNTNGGLDAAGALVARGGIAAHQTSAGAFDFSTDELRIRSYGATAGTGRITFRTGGGGGSTDTERMRITSAGVVQITGNNLTVNGRNVLNDIDGKAASSHTHSIANVTGLQTGLDQRLNYYSTPLNNDGTYKAAFESDGRYSVIGVGTNSSSSTNFPTGYGATWSFRPISGANSSNWGRHFDLHKASGDNASLYVRGRAGANGSPLAWQQVFTDEYHPNADKLTTARTISLTGDVTGSVSFDGSANVSISATVADDSHNHTYANIDGLSTGGIGGPRITTGSGYIEFGPANTSFAHIYTDRPAFYFNRDLQVNGQTVFHTAYHPRADKLTTARTISLTGDVTGSVSFDGSANVSISATVADDSHTHTILNSKGILAPETGRSVHGTGIYTYNRNNGTLGDSTPTSYWSVLGFGRGAGGMAQLASSWTSNGDQLWYRSLRDTIDNWFAWKRIFTDNYHPNADKLTTARSISLTGDVSGSVSFDGSANVSITATVADDSHNHTIANVDGLQAALDGKQAAGSYAAASHTHSYLPLSGGTVTGNITRSGQGVHLHHGSSSHSSGKITVSTSAPSGGSNGDIWLQV